MSNQPNPETETETPPAPEEESGKEPDAASLARELEKERRASAQYRSAAKKAEDALKAREEADLSETEKMAKERDQLRVDLEAERQRAKQVVVREKAKDLAHHLGIVDADVAYRLLDPEAIEYDGAGEPTNLESLLDALVKDKPYLAGKARPAGTGDPGRRGPTTQPNDLNAAIRKAAGAAS